MKPPGNENSASLEGQNALRVRVAELCPSKFMIRRGTFVESMTYWNIDGEQGEAVDPTHDLNACAEFEKGLTEEQCEIYFDLLNAPKDHDPKHPCEDYVMHAAAEQRCRAFILCHSKREMSIDDRFKFQPENSASPSPVSTKEQEHLELTEPPSDHVSAVLQKALKALRSRLEPKPAWFKRPARSSNSWEWWVTNFTHDQMEGNRLACVEQIDKALLSTQGVSSTAAGVLSPNLSPNINAKGERTGPSPQVEQVSAVQESSRDETPPTNVNAGQASTTG